VVVCVLRLGMRGNGESRTYRHDFARLVYAMETGSRRAAIAPAAGFI
jgi:hypothetical protein